MGYYSVKENKGHQILYVMDADGKNIRQLTTDAKNETDGAWIEGGRRIAFLRDGQLWAMNADGTGRRQLTNDKTDIEGFKFSPDGRHVLLIKSLPYHGTIKANPTDLPKATGRLVTDMNYRHWDHYVETIAHPFVAGVNDGKVDGGVDILEGQPYESPLAPFGGIEQFDWSKDSKCVAYTCRKKEGVQYAISTDADIYLYNIDTRETRNLCKPADYREPAINATKTMKTQAVNHQSGDMNVGYDVNPRFSPDGKYIAWQSMAHNGYESDRNRLCVYDLRTGEKKYVAESFDSNVEDFCWAADSRTLYFLGIWHACVMVYQTNLDGQVKQLTDGWYDYGSVQLLGNEGKQLLVTRHSISHPDDLFAVTPAKKAKASKVVQLTDENKHIFDQLALAKVQERWVKTTDGKEEQVWIILPPHFDPAKKYPALLFCEGGPQSPVSQFWSYRWNFQIMAANDYVIVAPNRRGLPGYGSAWNEEISGDWTGQCMNDYLSAIDDAVANLPLSTKTDSGPWVPRSAASRSTIWPVITTSVSRRSFPTTVRSTSNRCTPTPRRHGSPTGNMRMPTGTKTSRPTPREPMRTVRTSLLTNGTRPSSASTERKTIASMPIKAWERSTPPACVAFRQSCSSSPTRTTGCSNRKTAFSGSARSSTGSTGG